MLRESVSRQPHRRIETGSLNISYDPDNHDHMVKMRAEKVRRVAQEIPPTTINGPATGDLLVVGWGGTYGSITARWSARRRPVCPSRRSTCAT